MRDKKYLVHVSMLADGIVEVDASNELDAEEQIELMSYADLFEKICNNSTIGPEHEVEYVELAKKKKVRKK